MLRCACCAHRSLTAALEHFERGLACKYTAADSVKALNKIYMTLLDSSPDHAPGQQNLGCLEGGKVSGGGRGERGRVREMGRMSGSAVTHCDPQICAGKRMRVRSSTTRACTHHCCRCCGCGPCAGVMERWGTMLARPELQRYAEAATYFETAASKAGSPQQAAAILSRQDRCFTAQPVSNTGTCLHWHALPSACDIAVAFPWLSQMLPYCPFSRPACRALALLSGSRPVPVGHTPDFPVRLPATRQQLDALAGCLLARRPVVLAMQEADGNLQALEVKRALYRCGRLGVRNICTVAHAALLAGWYRLQACAVSMRWRVAPPAFLQLPVGAWQPVPGPATLC